MVPKPFRWLAGLALVGVVSVSAAARAEEIGSASADTVQSLAEADPAIAQRAFLVGIWSFDVIVAGSSRPGVVIRFEPQGTFDGQNLIWTREGRRVETVAVSGTWSLTSLGDDRWRINLQEVNQGARSSTFRRIGEDRILNEHTGRVVDRVPQYADS